jgi:hypothetical protein
VCFLQLVRAASIPRFASPQTQPIEEEPRINAGQLGIEPLIRVYSCAFVVEKGSRPFAVKPRAVHSAAGGSAVFDRVESSPPAVVRTEEFDFAVHSGARSALSPSRLSCRAMFAVVDQTGSRESPIPGVTVRAGWQAPALSLCHSRSPDCHHPAFRRGD